MFCKVCSDAGRPESEYTSHFVKNRQRVVVCPTLLSQACRICNNKGHTSSYCPEISRRDDHRYREEPSRHCRNTYQHPHGPHVRLVLESRALSASAPSAPSAPSTTNTVSISPPPSPPICVESQLNQPEPITIPAPALPAAPIDIRAVNLQHSASWGDEDVVPFVCDPHQLYLEFAQNYLMSSRTTKEEFDFIVDCDNHNEENCFNEDA